MELPLTVASTEVDALIVVSEVVLDIRQTLVSRSSHNMVLIPRTLLALGTANIGQMSPAATRSTL